MDTFITLLNPLGITLLSEGVSSVMDSLPVFDLANIGLGIVFVVLVLKGWVVPKSTADRGDKINERSSERQQEITQEWKSMADEWKDNYYKEREVSESLRISLTSLIEQGETTKKLNTEIIRQVPFPEDSIDTRGG